MVPPPKAHALSRKPHRALGILLLPSLTVRTTNTQALGGCMMGVKTKKVLRLVSEVPAHGGGARIGASPCFLDTNH